MKLFGDVNCSSKLDILTLSTCQSKHVWAVISISLRTNLHHILLYNLRCDLKSKPADYPIVGTAAGFPDANLVSGFTSCPGGKF